MKKVLLFALSTFAVASMNAQDCSSNIDFTASEMGFTPNPIVGSNAGQAYDEVITIAIPKTFSAMVSGMPMNVPLDWIKLVTITPEQADFFTDQDYDYEVWAKNLSSNDYESITVGSGRDTFQVDAAANFTYACLRMTNPSAPAPFMNPTGVDTVNIAVLIDAKVDVGIFVGWASESSLVDEEDLTFNVRFPKRAAGVSVENVDPNAFAIYGTFPNPATTEAWVKFSTPVSGNATLKVYDITGKTVINTIAPTVAGVNNLQVNLAGLNAGVYLYSLTIGNETMTSKLVVR